MITHSRETCQPTNIMRWENGVFSMVDLKSGEKVRQGPQINPLLLVHKSIQTPLSLISIDCSSPTCFSYDSWSTWPGCEETSCQVRTLGVGLRILGAWFSVVHRYSTIIMLMFAHILCEISWISLNIVQVYLFLANIRRFWTKCCLMPCSTPIVDSSHVFLINSSWSHCRQSRGSVQERLDWTG
jgi:hypothetical protein